MLSIISIVAISLFLLLIAGEAFYSRKKKLGYYERKDTWTSIAFGLFGVLTRVSTKGLVLGAWFLLYELSPFKIASGPFSLSILFLANEFIYYWFHRLSHEYRFLWATHVNHHSSNKMNFSVATRTPFLNAVYHFLFWIPLPLMGFHPLDILIVETVSFFFAFMQHTRIIPKLGWFEYILNTPSHHRVHHASNEKYINRNYGNVLIVFDRIFGTFQAEEEPPVYGLSQNVKDRSFPNIVFHEWKDILKDLRTAEYRPGYKKGQLTTKGKN